MTDPNNRGDSTYPSVSIFPVIPAPKNRFQVGTRPEGSGPLGCEFQPRGLGSHETAAAEEICPQRHSHSIQAGKQGGVSEGLRDSRPSANLYLPTGLLREDNSGEVRLPQ